MTIDWTKPIETTSGLPAKVVSKDFRNWEYGLCVLVQIEADYHSRVVTYTPEGKPLYSVPEIRNRKTKREGWINIYPNNCTSNRIYRTEEDAGKSSLKIATIKIEWEE